MPAAFERTGTIRGSVSIRSHASVYKPPEADSLSYFPPAALPCLPALRLTFSPEYLMPLPL
jgi:hypothetical protein